MNSNGSAECARFGIPYDKVIPARRRCIQKGGEKKRLGNSIVSKKPAGSLPGLNKYHVGANGSVVHSRSLNQDPLKIYARLCEQEGKTGFWCGRSALLRYFVWNETMLQNIALRIFVESEEDCEKFPATNGGNRTLSRPCEQRPDTPLIVLRALQLVWKFQFILNREMTLVIRDRDRSLITELDT